MVSPFFLHVPQEFLSDYCLIDHVHEGIYVENGQPDFLLNGSCMGRHVRALQHDGANLRVVGYHFSCSFNQFSSRFLHIQFHLIIENGPREFLFPLCTQDNVRHLIYANGREVFLG